VTAKTAAGRYARALLDVAVQERADLQLIDRQLTEFAGLFAQYPELAHVLITPAVPVPRKRAAVAELSARAGLVPILSKLVALLADRDRLGLLSDLAAAYRERLLDYQQIVRAEVTTAAALDASRAAAIERGLASMTGRTVRLATNVDPSIIGGVVARIGSTIYDGSVTRQLEKIKERLVESV
jgi:F-type H+-transporting ATPase subunit delta